MTAGISFRRNVRRFLSSKRNVLVLNISLFLSCFAAALCCEPIAAAPCPAAFTLTLYFWHLIGCNNNVAWAPPSFLGPNNELGGIPNLRSFSRLPLLSPQLSTVEKCTWQDSLTVASQPSPVVALAPPAHQHRPRQPYVRLRRARGDALLRQRSRFVGAGGVRFDPTGCGPGVQGCRIDGAFGRPAVPRWQGARLWWFAPASLPYNTQDDAPYALGCISATIMVALEISRQHFSIETPLGVCTLPVADVFIFMVDNSFGGVLLSCVLHDSEANVLRFADVARWYGSASFGGVYLLSCMAVMYYHTPSHPYNAGTEHVGVSPTRQTSLAPSTKRGEVFGESHEG